MATRALLFFSVETEPSCQLDTMMAFMGHVLVLLHLLGRKFMRAQESHEGHGSALTKCGRPIKSTGRRERKSHKVDFWNQMEVSDFIFLPCIVLA